jgi:type VI secretion system protein ImpF
MARQEVEAPVTISVLDRLIDLEPKTSSEPPLTRAQALRQLRASLRRDLEWLLNSRQPAEDTTAYAELERSVYRYGLPDITSLSLSAAKDQARLRRALEQAISSFEPRVSASRIAMEVLTRHARGIRFHIQGMLRVDPAPEPISFDTVLELPACQYEVKGE